jgi:CHASE2 domain-containing sensor protein
MSGANITAPLLSGALIGHQLLAAWALAMAALASIGAAMATRLMASPHRR